MDTIFTKIYENGTWINSETKSGPGSTYQQTLCIQEHIKRLVKKYNLQSLLDVPCGDFNWFKHIVDAIPNYSGGDIVKQIVEKNTILYPKHRFIEFNISTDKIPEGVDVIFCRDLLVHLSLKDILQTLKNIKQSSAKYILMTTFINREFKDIDVGGWRPISFFDKPFCFPQPLELVNEKCTEFYPKYIDKSLGLWRVEDIPDYIPLKLYQCWHEKDLPEILKSAGEKIRKDNPSFEHHVFDFDECEKFIEENFDIRVLNAYKKLIPKSYKTDLWRYCVIYINGGIYLDISFEPINDFKFDELINKDNFSSEVGGLMGHGSNPYAGVSNGLMALKPKNERLLMTINKIVEHVESLYYGKGVYDITGATLLGEFFMLDEKKALTSLKRSFNSKLNGFTFNGKDILRRIEGYDKNITKNNIVKKSEYEILWKEKRVFMT